MQQPRSTFFAKARHMSHKGSDPIWLQGRCRYSPRSGAHGFPSHRVTALHGRYSCPSSTENGKEANDPGAGRCFLTRSGAPCAHPTDNSQQRSSRSIAYIESGDWTRIERTGTGNLPKHKPHLRNWSCVHSLCRSTKRGDARRWRPIGAVRYLGYNAMLLVALAAYMHE